MPPSLDDQVPIGCPHCNSSNIIISMYQHPQTSDIHKPMPKKHPEHQVARSCLQRRTFEQDKTSHVGDENKEAEMGIDRSYNTQACSQHHLTNPGL